MRRLVVALLLALAATAPRAEEPARLAEARSASTAGDFAAALRAYDAYLAEHPDDEAVRLEAARVRSWTGDYGNAIDAYRAHLATAPGDRAIRLELAKVLSWAQRYDESVAAFEALLADRPDERDPLLGLARVQSWAGHYPESIAAYEKLLASDPTDVEARVGLGRALSWSGDLSRAGAQYDAVLSSSPENADALLGKSQVAFWSGEQREAARYLGRAEAAASGNRDVAAFRKQLEKAGRPTVESTLDRVQDTDGNDYGIVRASARFRIAPGVTLAGVYTHSDAYLGRRQENACVPLAAQEGSVASVDFLGARLDAGLGRGVGIRGTLGVELVDPSVGDSRTRPAGSVAAWGPIAGRWRWNAAAEHRTFDATRVIIDCDVTYSALAGGADGAIGDFRLGGNLGVTDFSDGNRRLQLDAWTTRAFRVAGQTLEASYRFRTMRYDENLASGYFDPQRFTSHLVGVALRGQLGTPRLDYAARIDAGVQSLHAEANVVDAGGTPLALPGFSQTNDTVFGWEARLGWQITDHARVEAYYGRTDYAAQAATGFESSQSGLLFRYRF